MKKVLLLLAFLLISSTIWAQSPKAGSVGILAAIGYDATVTDKVNATIGVNWFIVKEFAVRPSITFMLSGTTVTAPTEKSNLTSWIGFGVAAFYEIDVGSGFLVGLGANFDVGFHNVNITRNDTYVNGAGTTDTLDTVLGIALLVDLQYSFSKNFAVFADVGLGYTSTVQSVTDKYTSTIGTVTTTGAVTTTFGIARTSLGVIFYL